MLTPEQIEALRVAAVAARNSTGSRDCWDFMDQATPTAILNLIAERDKLLTIIAAAYEKEGAARFALLHGRGKASEAARKEQWGQFTQPQEQPNG